MSEIDGEVLQALRQRRHHIPQQPLFLLGAVATAGLQTGHSPLASMKHLQCAEENANLLLYFQMFKHEIISHCQKENLSVLSLGATMHYAYVMHSMYTLV